MKITTYLLLTLSFSASISASECNISADLLSAYYSVTSQLTNKQEQGSVVAKDLPKSESQLLELHRKKNRVLKRNMSQGVHDIWTVHGKRYSLSRAFDEYQHAIEYQSNELNYQPQQQDIFQIVSTPALEKMHLLKQQNSGCQLEQYYTLASATNEYQLVWLPQLRLVKFFQVKNASITKQWRLDNYQDNADKISSLFNQYDHYQSTDYADIGDNESIPFLAAMIYQGFSTPQNKHGASHTGHHDH